MSLTMVLLAAGMGKRFGGPKQLEPVGPAGECIIDYNAHDAVRAGFDRLVVVTRAEIEEPVRAVLDAGAARQARTDVVLQEIPQERTKPRGTAEAVAIATRDVDEPLGICNSDDLYGPGSFRVLAEHLRSHPDEGAVVGFPLVATVPARGAVSRGLIRVEADRVVGVSETHGITAEAVDPDALCSMNLWGMPASFLSTLHPFAARDSEEELLLPDAVREAIDGGLVVRMLVSNETWAGMTNPEDVATVRARAADGWPSPLWER